VWNILDIVYNDIHYTKQTFWDLVSGTQYEDLSLKLNEKINKLHNKVICENAGHRYDGECFDIVKTPKDYGETIETIEIPIYEEISSTCKRLDEELKVIEYDCMEQHETGETQSQVVFKDNCNWNIEDGYYCEERVLV